MFKCIQGGCWVPESLDMVQGTMPKYFMVPLLTTLKHECRQTLFGVILLFTSFSEILEYVPVEDFEE